MPSWIDAGDRMETATRAWLRLLARGPARTVAWAVVLGLLLMGWGIGLSI
jgi:hypothetical protein